MRAAIDEAAANGVPNLITFSGNRSGMADAEGADNCVAFLNGSRRTPRTRTSRSAWSS